jgi:hypothetical protein
VLGGNRVVESARAFWDMPRVGTEVEMIAGRWKKC